MADSRQQRLLDVLLPRIDAARVQAGLTWQDVSEVSGIDVHQWSRWVRGKAVPSLVDLCRLAMACDVSLAFFLVAVDEAKEGIAWANHDTPSPTI